MSTWSRCSSRGDGDLRLGGGFRVDGGVDVVKAATDDALSNVIVFIFVKVGRVAKLVQDWQWEARGGGNDVERCSGWGVIGNSVRRRW